MRKSVAVDRPRQCCPTCQMTKIMPKLNKSIIIMAADDLLGVGAIGKEQVFLNDSFGGGWAAVVSWALAAQNCSATAAGAFTGEVSSRHAACCCR